MKTIKNETHGLRLLIQAQYDCAEFLRKQAERDLAELTKPEQIRLTQWDYNGDHVDYNTAAASVLSWITDQLCMEQSPIEDIIADLNKADIQESIGWSILDFDTDLQHYVVEHP